MTCIPPLPQKNLSEMKFHVYVCQRLVYDTLYWYHKLYLCVHAGANAYNSQKPFCVIESRGNVNIFRYLTQVAHKTEILNLKYEFKAFFFCVLLNYTIYFPCLNRLIPESDLHFLGCNIHFINGTKGRELLEIYDFRRS